MCEENCTLITHIDYIDTKCADCEEAEAADAAAEAERRAEDEKNALSRSEKREQTEDEYWERAMDDFVVYAESNGWVF